MARQGAAWAFGWACGVAALALAVPAASSDVMAFEGMLVTGVKYGYGATWGLYRCSASADKLEQILPGAAFARYSPDRQQYVFARGGNLWLHRPDGSKRPLGAGETPWPDARHVTWQEDGEAVIFPMVDASGIAFQHPHRLVSVDLAAFGAGGAFMRHAQFVGMADWDQCEPAVSASGSIAVCAVAELPDVGLLSSHVHLRQGTGAWQRLTDWPDTLVELRPAFSSDGGRVSFDVVDTEDRRRYSYVYDLHENALHSVELPENVPAFMRNTWALAWQPHGDSLAIGWGQFGAEHRSPTRLGVWSVGGAVERIASGSEIRDVAWAPDGECLAVIRDGSGRPPGGSALFDVAIVVYYEADQPERREEILYEASWADHLEDMFRWDPVVPIDLEW